MAVSLNDGDSQSPDQNLEAKTTKMGTLFSLEGHRDFYKKQLRKATDQALQDLHLEIDKLSKSPGSSRKSDDLTTITRLLVAIVSLVAGAGLVTGLILEGHNYVAPVVSAICAALTGGLASRRYAHTLTKLLASGFRFSSPNEAFPKFWTIFRYCMPRAVRERVYEPAHQELLEDYLITRRTYQSKAARRWLTCCFTVRTIVMVLASLRAWLGDRVIRGLKGLVLLFVGEKMVYGLREVLRLFRL